MHRSAPTIAAALALLLTAGPAAADFAIDSYFTGSDAPLVDGDLGEWSTAEGEELIPFIPLGQEDRVAGTGAWEGEEDISGEFAIAHNDEGLYAAFKITDQRLIRTKQLSTAEDHVALWFAVPKKRGGFKLVGVGVFADPSRYQAPVEVRWLKPKKPKAGEPVKGASAAVHGDQWTYRLELALPWAALGVSPAERKDLRAVIHLVDGDMSAKLARKSVLGNAPEEWLSTPDKLPRLTQGDLGAGLDAFCDAKGLPSQGPRFSVAANIAGDKTPENVMIVDRYIVAQGPAIGGPDAYAYNKLGVKDGDAVQGLEVQELTGDKRAELVVTFREEHAGTTREWIEIYQVSADLAFELVFTAATRVERGPVVIENSYRFVRGKGKRKAIEMRPGRVEGVTADTIGDSVPDEGGTPMVLPWDKPAKRRYTYQGGSFLAE